MASDPIFDRPIFIISPPRSGSTLLFETLAQAPALYTIGGESHALIEGVPQLSITAHNCDSNRLTEADAAPAVAETLRQRFLSALRDRDGAAPRSYPLRMLEKTPKNALRIPFLARAFPEARFVYLHRDPRQVMASMLEAWRPGRFRTYGNLPGWPAPYWSLVLVPGWRALAGKSLPEIVATQWETCTRIALDDLEALPPDRWIAARYDALNADWGGEVRRLCAALELAWYKPTDGPLPLARHTVTRPDPDKWRATADAFEPHMKLLDATMARAARVASISAAEI